MTKMINNILAVGDSFTYGEELENRNHAYPYYLARGLKADVVNEARPGSGNKRMIRTVIEYITNNNPVDLVVIGWSSAGRMEFADMGGQFDLWPGYSGNLFKRDKQDWRLELLDYINKYHDPEYLYHQHLLDVILMQSFLQTRDIKYIMINTDFNEYYHNNFNPKMINLSAQVDAKHYLGWPSEGMSEWTQGCKRGPEGHFLDEGHRKVTQKLYEHIRNLGWA